jgi:hypothetical protein
MKGVKCALDDYYRFKWDLFLGVCQGLFAIRFFGTLPLRGIGLTGLLQLPNSYPCIRVHKLERQFDLFVSVKGNVDEVQSRAASA